MSTGKRAVAAQSAAKTIDPTTASNDNPSQVSTQRRATKQSPLLPKLRMKDQIFVNEYIKNGYNGTQAYLAVKSKGKNPNTARTEAYKNLQKPHIRQAIIDAMSKWGVDEDTVSQRISHQLSHRDPWISNEGIKHSCKILGLYAPTESHLQVDKRSVTVTLSAEDSKQLLKELMSKSK